MNEIFSHKRFLVADAQELLRQLVRDAVRGLPGAEVIVVGDGLQAVKTLSSTPVHAIICDPELPPFGGLDVLRAIRCGLTKAEPGLPALMIGASFDQNTVSDAAQLQIQGLAQKPISLEALIKRLRAALTKKIDLSAVSVDKNALIRRLSEAREEAKAQIERAREQARLIEQKAASAAAHAHAHAASGGAVPSRAGTGDLGPTVMRQIERLRTGDQLGGDVRLNDGSVVLKAGTILTERNVSRLMMLHDKGELNMVLIVRPNADA